MPMLGLGVYQLTDPQECERAVINAIDAGYRLIDTASAYGNEKAVGQAIKNSGINRNELFITTKVWVSDAGYGSTKNAIERSLQRLDVDYIDLYLVHQAVGDYYGSWRAMSESNKNGTIRTLGVSNFFPDRIADLIAHHEIKPAVNQIEVHPFYQRAHEHQFLQRNDVQVQSWASFAEGRNDLFLNDLLAGIGRRYNKSVAQVTLRWLIQRGIAVIPRSARKERIKENAAIWDFSLTAEEMSAIATLDRKVSAFFDHRDPGIIAKWVDRKF